jgi:hypothetical protein
MQPDRPVHLANFHQALSAAADKLGLRLVAHPAPSGPADARVREALAFLLHEARIAAAGRSGPAWQTLHDAIDQADALLSEVKP